jgi:hypothetical protein
VAVLLTLSIPFHRCQAWAAALPFVIPSAAERPAVRPAPCTKVFVPLVLPQNRHPERSAPQICRVIQSLWRGVEEPVLSVAEGTSAMLILPMLF